MDNTERFTEKAAFYDQARPSYALEFISWLAGRYALAPGKVVADIGSGTGKLADLLVKSGCLVYGVEPNDAMRRAGEANLAAAENFISLKASAEHTTLPDSSVDLVTVGQAFHWFDFSAFRNECRRVLKNPQAIVLVWNIRVANEQAQETAELLHRFCPRFTGFGGGAAALADQIDWFFDSDVAARHFANDLRYDREGFIARTCSGSYAPDEREEGYAAFVAALSELFDKFAVDGVMTIANETVAYSPRN